MSDTQIQFGNLDKCELEAFKRISNNLRALKNKNGLKIFAVTSDNYKDNNSHTVAKLGYVLAKGLEKVLVVDCDFANPQLHKLFNVKNSKGITTAYDKKTTISDCIQSSQEESNVNILTSGPSSNYEIRLIEFFYEEIKNTIENYDYVIIDAPPVLKSSSTGIISEKADGVIISVFGDKTKKEDLKTAVRDLEKVNANIIGTILTNYDTKVNKFHY